MPRSFKSKCTVKYSSTKEPSVEFGMTRVVELEVNLDEKLLFEYPSREEPQVTPPKAHARRLLIDRVRDATIAFPSQRHQRKSRLRRDRRDKKKKKERSVPFLSVVC